MTSPPPRIQGNILTYHQSGQPAQLLVDTSAGMPGSLQPRPSRFRVTRDLHRTQRACWQQTRWRILEGLPQALWEALPCISGQV
jgi:hypothetical protein